jgi:hypothetical protein
MDFSIPFRPISLQARSSQIKLAKIEFQKHLPSTNFLFSGDVKLEIEWMIHERARYESDAAPDVDNILKPLMDILCGPKGILIDDNQVQSVTCYWVDWNLSGEQLNFRICFSPDEFVRKDGLIFVGLGNSLYIPTNTNIPPEPLLLLLKTFQSQYATRLKLRTLGKDYYEANPVMSIQRVFHRSRLSQFQTVEIATLIEQTEQLLRTG